MLQVVVEVALGELPDAVVGRLEADLRAHQPELITDALRHVRARPIGAVERDAQIGEQLRTIGEHLGPQVVEHLHGGSIWVGRRLEHQRGNRPDEHDLADASRAVSADVPHDFAATGGMTDQHHIAQVQRLDHGGEIVGVVVHGVAVPALARATVPAPVVGDGAEAVRRHEQQLRVPHVGVEGPAVAEHHGLPRPPVLVEDRCFVLRDDGGHGVLLAGDCRDTHTMCDAGPSLRQSFDCRLRSSTAAVI